MLAICYEQNFQVESSTRYNLGRHHFPLNYVRPCGNLNIRLIRCGRHFIYSEPPVTGVLLFLLEDLVKLAKVILDTNKFVHVTAYSDRVCSVTASAH